MNHFGTRIQNTDPPSLGIVGALAAISVLMVGSTGIAERGFWNRDTIVQTAAYILGFLVLLLVLRVGYHILHGSVRGMYIASLIMLLSVYVPGLGVEQFGARSWIRIPGVTTIQPSELVKILFVLILAEYLEKHSDDLYHFGGMVKCGLLAAPIIAIVLKEDLGSALVFSVIWLAMIFYAGLNMTVFLEFIALVAAAVPAAYLFMADYQKERIAAFLHPENLSLAGNYQVYESKIAIGSGGLLGKGLFRGTQKALDFIPVQKSDFIFSVIAEELGLIGGLVVIALFAALLIRFLKIALGAADLYGALIVVGFIGMFVFQIFENIAMTMGMMPVTGITLPFVSYGGSSVLSSMISLGFIMSVSDVGHLKF